MNVPTATAGCPPGLEYLTTLDRLYVEEQVDVVDLFLGFEQNNKYIIKNCFGQNVIKSSFNSNIQANDVDSFFFI